MASKQKSDGGKVSIIEAVNRFGNDESAQEWLIETRWPNGVKCPACGNEDVAERKRRRNLREWRCKDRKTCSKIFTVKTDTVMHNSRLPLSKWAMAYFLCVTNLKGVSSNKLKNDLKIRQATAWHLVHRIRKSMETEGFEFAGPVEVDETYMGGKRKNRPKHVREQESGRGAVGKAIVVGMKDRESNQVSVQVVESTDRATLQSFVRERTSEDAVVFTDEHPSYSGMRRVHGTVRHKDSEYVKQFFDLLAHTNGIESLWSMLKRGYVGVFHHMSAKHLDKYVVEFATRHNLRGMDTVDQMEFLVANGEGKSLPYAELIGPEYTRQPELL